MLQGIDTEPRPPGERYFAGTKSRYHSEMTRRSFATAMVGAAVIAGAGVPVAAVYGARLPQTLRIPRRIASPCGWFELRTYTGKTERLAALFARSGIQAHPLGRGRGASRFLFPFPSLEERGRAWDRLNGDPAWLLTRGQVRLTEVTIYRYPGGRIFDRSL